MVIDVQALSGLPLASGAGGPHRRQHRRKRRRPSPQAAPGQAPEVLVIGRRRLTSNFRNIPSTAAAFLPVWFAMAPSF